MDNNIAKNKYVSIMEEQQEKVIYPVNREEIIKTFAPLIRYIAKKLAARLPANVDIDDLLSSGAIGLMDAIEKYDPTKDNKFKTYAEFRIRGAMLDELRAQDWIPRSIREKAKFLDKVYAQLEKDLGRNPTDEEIANCLGVSLDKYYEVLAEVKAVSFLSLDEYVNFNNSEDAKKSIIGILEDFKARNPLEVLNVENLKNIITQCIKTLPEKERLVLSLYYYEDLNLKEIGEVLNVTESRVSQLHTQAILRLRSKLKDKIEQGDL